MTKLTVLKRNNYITCIFNILNEGCSMITMMILLLISYDLNLCSYFVFQVRDFSATKKGLFTTFQISSAYIKCN